MIMKILEIIFRWMGNDGMRHCITSAFMCAMLNLITIPFGAAFVAFLVGIAKEAYDGITKRGTAELTDVICNLIGIGIATIASVS